MGESHQEGSGAGADFDLTQFYQIFFEEAGENLDQMEHILLDLDLTSANDEELNGIFRCAHSIKGGAATFGFSDVAELTHHMESLLDRLRRHEIQPIPEMVDVLLESADASRSLLARHQAGGEGEGVATTELVRRISELAAGTAATKPAPVPAPVVAAPATPPPPVVAVAAPVVKAAPTAPGMRQIQVRIGPLEQPDQADAVKELFRDIPGLGTISDLPCNEAQMRLFAVETTSSDEDLCDLFIFHVAKEQVHITEISAPDEFADIEFMAPVMLDAASAYGFFQDSPGAPASEVTAVVPAAADAAVGACGNFPGLGAAGRQPL